MKAHLTRNASTIGVNARHETAVADVPAASGLIGAHVVGADDRITVLGDENLVVWFQPIAESVFLAHAGVECIRLPRSNYGSDYGPDRFAICG